MTRDEFCHFLLGRCTYTHESGEVIEIVPGTAAFFPQGWRGTCRVHETDPQGLYDPVTDYCCGLKFDPQLFLPTRGRELK